jgi:hypothetical protein
VRGIVVLALGAALLAGASSAAAPAAGAAPERAAQAPGGSGWTAKAQAFRGQNGSRFLFTCPKYGTPSAVWGTDVYTDDSSVCTAAVHTGRITFAGGGTVTIEIRPGQSSYTGSTRNRVTTSSYPSWGGSFVVVAATAANPGVGAGGTGWTATATSFRLYVGARFAYSCPANGTPGVVWGTNVYTDDSSVCTAAVHAGKITLARGGNVTIEMRDGQSSYTASTRNGITTRSYPAWPASFVIVGAPGGPTTPPDGTATGTVLVNGQPFTSGPVPYGSKVDVTNGRLTLKADVGTVTLYGDGKDTAQFVPSRTSERVKGKKRALVQFTLIGGDFSTCGASRRTASSPLAGDAKKKPKVVRALWGSGKGKFRTRGRYASATVRGTIWLTADRCDGTLTQVRQGVVSVVDFTRKRTVRVRAGRSYLAPARR